ncbi:molybdopterin-binding protein [Corynebacterium uberis]|uniref:molybdopterin-binding protein n=1 Tax=Corynebacterium TaxID=1716 RepID=UPI001D0A0A7D|nr:MULTISPECIES: molybdopterin-binding protein [Corynebacterium]MCZ9309011.1 molybdopterin-binding protein [Corynebacterium sp. c6VSa_13]UDL74521.1 MogA/MoaB family molybdenum cofactor biosynthesis protein [Corynebacterium uberis]UDL76645.1 MogA/MoaB family molybdenum cofactor biosynthesis protein [Corynebacterium uberis]UDL78858.1 MogA/MoaB family molybdenum cofactor biosynthesis protein [Corynebacterium uberis]UDL81136.1 MogA/MoaB family molybdenum cofactor biosynthesis protein [Corynebacter
MRTARVIVVSDRVAQGGREDTSGPEAIRLLAQMADRITDGLQVEEAPVVVPEGAEPVADALDAALDAGVGLVITCGGTGLSPHNKTPEVTKQRLVTLLPGVVTQMVVAGLANSSKAGLSRGVVGISASGALVVNAPGSLGGVRDALAVLAEVADAIFRQLDEA